MSERQEILSRKVPEDEKKNKGTPILDNEKSVETAKFTNTVPSTSSVIKQTTLSRYVSCPLSKKDNHHFENLILLMMVSNGLSFTFLKNKETQEVFRFIAPALKLPGRHAISNRILSKSAKQLTQSIVEQAKADVIGVTAAFNGWTNVKQEHLFGVVFITSSGKTLIWGLMNNAELKQIKINCYVSDSAGEYAVARRQLRIEYPNKVFLPFRVTLITKCSSERIGTPIWTQLFELQNLLLPICGALNKLQRDVSRLYEITHYFGWIIKMFSSHKDKKFVVLHPKYRISKFNSSNKKISYTHFEQWLIYYYQAWFNEMPTRIFRDYLSYQRELFPFNPEIYNQFEENIIDFWESALMQLHDILCKRKQDDDENNDDSEFTFNAFNDSDTEKLEETSIINDFNTENDSNNLDSREVEPYDFEVGGHDTQPVPLAKCKLLELFNDSLEASIYMI
ncbi:zinc finger BED domain-containing protein 1-like [Rhizophagus irregularis DAOM 181602=DAOM 197198]|nr:zinc finger BED domain-containing protein 1-like [Rhizophagus irregularis DAOM 181602=DAOM 197198]